MSIVSKLRGRGPRGRSFAGLEPFEARLLLSAAGAALRGDFTGDGVVDARDVDQLAADVRAGLVGDFYDLTGDGRSTRADVDALIYNVLRTNYGDADLNGAVGAEDFLAWQSGYPGGVSWSTGDFDGDGRVTGRDFLTWQTTYTWQRPAGPRIIYVDRGATAGLNDGSRWQDAYVDLSTALVHAAVGDEIWVAAGTYYPSGATDRAATFAMVPAVAIYGGFAGDETQLGQRDPAAHVTILSGDIGIAGDAADNSYTVVVGADGALLDGFTITGGNADDYDWSSPPDRRHYNGAGMYNDGVSVEVVNSTFRDNTTSDRADINYGGAVFNLNGADATFQDCLFVGNYSQAGGAIANEASTARVINSTFQDNAAQTDGGAIDNVGNSTLILEGCSFSRNRSSASGLAVSNWGSTMRAQGSDFDGAGTGLGPDAHGISNVDATVYLTDSTIRNFTGSDSSGTGMNSQGSDVTLERCRVLSNTLYDIASGAGLYSYGGTLTLIDSLFENNSSQRSGAAVTAGGLTLRVVNSVFRDNFSGERLEGKGTGGAMDLWDLDSVVVNCIFQDNEALGNGGGLNQRRGSLLVQGSLFVGNTGRDGGGLAATDGCIAQIRNSVFVGNHARGFTTDDRPGRGGGVFGAGTISNSIIRDNIALTDGDNVYGTFTIAFSDIQGSGPSGARWNAALGTDGGGNIDADPRFSAPGHWTGASWDVRGGDYSLTSHSPCIDAGDNAAVGPDAFDLDGDGDTLEPLPVDLLGQARFVDDPLTADTGAGAAPIVDMGAYEFI